MKKSSLDKESSSKDRSIPPKGKNSTEPNNLLISGVWMLTISLVLTAIYLGWRAQSNQEALSTPTPTSPSTSPTPAISNSTVITDNELPSYLMASYQSGITRLAVLHTNIPTRSRTKTIEYTVATGDSVFGIAQSFNLEPETILWANYDQLNDSPDLLDPGMELNIPPTNGVYYQWQDGDSIESVAAKFEANVQSILGWEGNDIDLTNPTVEPGQWVMVPNGHREFRQWLVPTIARSNSGVSKSVLGPGACEGNYDGAYGSGAFTWPTASHVLSGNDFWSGHLGIDIAGSVGDGVRASDAGVVVFSGWANGGYGYMVMIDHGNGYQTLYAHLSAYGVSCGQSVSSGSYIGAVGSTGNSTGAHLHFEVRYMGGFISPWYVLPAP